MAMAMACSGCTLILEPENAQCWCGEQWSAQISGATSYGVGGAAWSIPASVTTYSICVTQREHNALDAANPEDPLYVALRSSLESGAMAKCESEGIELWGIYFANTDCATAGVANIFHEGACWKSEDIEAGKYCPLFPECEPYYDCSSEPIWDGGDEAAEGVSWECPGPA